MKILISCETMTYLSGSPLYNYTLAMELVKEHDVSISSKWEDNYLKRNLEKAGVHIKENNDGEYDLALISQRGFGETKCKTINIIHSEYDCETPIDGCDYYIAIRPSIKEHLISHHNIAEDKITVVYNGVDLERFKPIKKEERDYIKVVIPATRDSLRQKMFDFYTQRANKDLRVYIYGKDFGAVIPTNEFIQVFNEVDNIEEKIGDADIVAGILLGRVNLEARAMNVLSRIHNPDNPEEFTEYFPDRLDFENKHDIKKVVKQILSI